MTSRGMDAEDMKRIAAMIVEVLHNLDNEAVLEKVKTKVAELCDAHPLYP